MNRTHTIRYVTDPQSGRRWPIPAGGADDGAPEGEGEGGEGTEAPEGEGEAKTLTQSEIDEIVERRLARERQKYADYDDLKAKASELEELQEAEKTELQREQEAREAAEERAQEYEQQLRQAALERALLDAASGKASKPSLVVKLADRDGLDPDDTDAVTAAVDKVLEEAPELKGGGVRVPSADGGARPTTQSVDMNRLIRSAVTGD